jgi:hypothetical protein
VSDEAMGGSYFSVECYAYSKFDEAKIAENKKNISCDVE